MQTGKDPTHPLLIYLLATLAFGGVFVLNNHLTHHLYWVPGAHVIHIPSGIKLLLVLVLGYLGSLSVLTAIFVAGPFSYFYTGELLLPLQIAIAAALAEGRQFRLTDAHGNIIAKALNSEAAPL